jgi:hypothetical protein
LKKCPVCGSLDQESDLTCGICGHDLSEVGLLTEEGVPILAPPQTSPPLHVNVPGFLGLFTGLGLIVLGAFLLFSATSYTGALLSLLSVGLGVLAIAITRDIVEDRRYRLYGSYRLRPLSVRGPRYIRDERKVEDQEDRKRASGEAD